MRIKLFARVFIILQVGLFLAACEYDTIETVKLPDNGGNQDISFDTQIIPIFTGSCVGCHGGSINPDLRAENAFNSLTTGNYINTTTPEASGIYTKLLSGSHESRATATEKLLILTWIQQGAKNN